MPASGEYIPIFGVWDRFRYTITCMMHKHHMSLTRVLVAGNGVGAPGNGHTLPCAHKKLYTRDSNQSVFLNVIRLPQLYSICFFWILCYDNRCVNVYTCHSESLLYYIIQLCCTYADMTISTLALCASGQ